MSGFSNPCSPANSRTFASRVACPGETVPRGDTLPYHRRQFHDRLTVTGKGQSDRLALGRRIDSPNGQTHLYVSGGEQGWSPASPSKDELADGFQVCRVRHPFALNEVLPWLGGTRDPTTDP